MAKIELNNEQLHLIQRALDFYSRIGIGQFDRIKDHPTFERHLEEVCRPKREPQVGDRTPQGEILEIKDGKALINGSVDKKTGHWCEKKEWKKLKNVVLSTDYSRYHDIRKEVDASLTQPRNMLINDYQMSQYASWGIYHPSVDNSCREAFDLVQIIRHEFWKANPERSIMTVDSSVHLSAIKNEVKVEIDPVK